MHNCMCFQSSKSASSLQAKKVLFFFTFSITIPTLSHISRADHPPLFLALKMPTILPFSFAYRTWSHCSHPPFSLTGCVSHPFFSLTCCFNHPPFLSRPLPLLSSPLSPAPTITILPPSFTQFKGNFWLLILS